MIHGAALGIAMHNAVPSVKAIANRHTLSNSHDGVAHAIVSASDGLSGLVPALRTLPLCVLQ